MVRARYAIILGSLATARVIARQLEEEGFETLLYSEIEKEPLPSVADLTGISAGISAGAQKLKAILGRLASQEGHWFVHPGVTTWAERSELSVIVQELGLELIAPPPQVLNFFGNKLNLLHEAARLGVPTLVLSDPMSGIREVERWLKKSGRPFPVIIKSAKGGGSFGIFALQDANELEARFPLWIEQLRRNAGEVILFAERYIEGARHILIPFSRFVNGQIKTFPSVDASLQCRYRKVVEVCPVTGIDAEIEDQLREWTEQIAEHCRYVGVGVLEFLVEGSQAYFVDGSARLNTGFHLWEQVAGTHAVSWQLMGQLMGGRSTPMPPCDSKSAWSAGVALRIYAEDPLLQLPQVGVLHEISECREWDFSTASAEFHHSDASDPAGLLGILFASGKDRKQANAVARGVLREIWIAGSLQTNERFLSELLAHPWVAEGIFHAGFVDEEFLPVIRPSAELGQLFGSVGSLLSPGISPDPSSHDSSWRWAVGDQWVRRDPSVVIDWTTPPVLWKAGNLPGLSGQVRLNDGTQARVCAYPLATDKWLIRIGAWSMIVRRVRVSAKASPKARSLVSGKVHSVLFREGAVVPAHQPFLIIESMNMLIPHATPVAARILRWHVQAEDQVHTGQDLAEIEVVPG